ncbi:diguanylate cyclase [Thiohalorhabdus methylotrophus]|uniref:Diguanylate cyclase n=1 Tax=Thiohalorhabdus methylotrophus TaxID=3242694 RepID=A0ABV4TX84_9GAMM
MAEGSYRLLLVEDNPADAGLVAELLEEAADPGFTLTHADRLEAALALAEARSFDVVLLDLGLPDSQGLDTARRFRGSSCCPVVILTGQEDQTLGRQAIQLGVQDFIPKADLAPAMLERVLHYAVERHRTQMRLRLLAAAFESGQAVLITDAAGTIEEVNSAFTAITGYEAEEVIGCNPNMLASGYHDAKFYRALWDQILEEGHWEGEIWNRHKSGRIFPEWESISAVRNEAGEVERFVAVFHDISEQKRLEAELERLATHDRLTGIYNRTKLYELLGQAQAAHERYGIPFSVIMFDIDHFKAINDRQGHHAGDQALCELTRRIEENLRDTDALGRWGGEEFLVLATSSDIEATARLAERLRAVVAGTPFEAVGTVTISLGVASIQPGESVTQLEERADRALYMAKGTGRNRVERADSAIATG